MIFFVDVIDREVSENHFLDHFFSVVKFFEISYPAGAFPITAFVGCNLFFCFHRERTFPQ